MTTAEPLHVGLVACSCSKVCLTRANSRVIHLATLRAARAFGERHYEPGDWFVLSARHDLDRSAYVLAGSVQQIVEYLAQFRETLGISYVTIPSDQMDDFAGVVDQLAGR